MEASARGLVARQDRPLILAGGQGKLGVRRVAASRRPPEITKIAVIFWNRVCGQWRAREEIAHAVGW